MNSCTGVSYRHNICSFQNVFSSITNISIILDKFFFYPTVFIKNYYSCSYKFRQFFERIKVSIKICIASIAS